MIKAQHIFDSIIKEVYGITPDHIGIDSCRKQVRNRYSFLMQNIVLRDRGDFKEKGSHMIPEREAPIIRDLLSAAIKEDGDSMIPDWFNGNLDLANPQVSMCLYIQLEALVMASRIKGETDEVTTDEWLTTIGAVINYNTARATLALQKELERFRENSLALNQNIAKGDLIVETEDGSRFYRLRGKKELPDLEKMTIGQLLDTVDSQNDYLELLAQILEAFEKHAEKRAIEDIFAYAQIKETFELRKADDVIGTDALASEYVIWYQRVHEFLVKNPQTLKQIEERAKTTGLSDFFKMCRR